MACRAAAQGPCEATRLGPRLDLAPGTSGRVPGPLTQAGCCNSLSLNVNGDNDVPGVLPHGAAAAAAVVCVKCLSML